MRRTLIALTALATIAVACGDSGSTETTTAGDGGGSAGATVEIANFQFTPADVQVSTGATVTFQLEEGTHTSTSSDGIWASGAMSAGDTFTVTFDEAGSFSYFCEFHPQMQGTITVSG